MAPALTQYPDGSLTAALEPGARFVYSNNFAVDTALNLRAGTSVLVDTETHGVFGFHDGTVFTPDGSPLLFSLPANVTMRFEIGRTLELPESAFRAKIRGITIPAGETFVDPQRFAQSTEVNPFLVLKDTIARFGPNRPQGIHR